MEVAKFGDRVHQSLIGRNSLKCLFFVGLVIHFLGIVLGGFLGNFSIFDFLVEGDLELMTNFWASCRGSTRT